MSPHFLYVVTICFSDPEPELREWTNDQVSRSVEYGIYPDVILNISTFIINNNNNNYDNLYGAVTRPYRYKGASQTAN